ncbi:hypothetical protein NC651_009840 [Populus alba x Populus x berolinensis]|nr:hypothetical protein NC651_009840 [Populus alba x Populus x berolinensis]
MTLKRFELQWKFPFDNGPSPPPPPLYPHHHPGKSHRNRYSSRNSGAPVTPSSDGQQSHTSDKGISVGAIVGT